MDEILLQEISDSIVKEVQPEAVFLFGSYARGKSNKSSDVDLLVIMQEAENAPIHRRQITGKLYRCLASLPIPKDILVYTTNEVEKWRNVPGHIIATGMNEGRQLYGRS